MRDGGWARQSKACWARRLFTLLIAASAPELRLGMPPALFPSQALPTTQLSF